MCYATSLYFRPSSLTTSEIITDLSVPSIQCLRGSSILNDAVPAVLPARRRKEASCVFQSLRLAASDTNRPRPTHNAMRHHAVVPSNPDRFVTLSRNDDHSTSVKASVSNTLRRSGCCLLLVLSSPTLFHTRLVLPHHTQSSQSSTMKPG